ncbi:PIG-X-domain-containing protein [Coniochaeta sp. PMI_546]|nr:PIG-X-domain-containing protein [Coniochaeta sp. PMI_546]
MRQRVTFITKPVDALDPDKLSIVDGTLTGPLISAVREDRLTFALDELPGAIQKILKDSHELHIRWSSPTPSETVSPLVSRIPPGFHVFYTPRNASAAESESLCLALRSLFGDINCRTPKHSFTSLEQGRFSHATSSQYFQQMDSLAHFSAHMKKVLCLPDDSACIAELARLDDAASLDISYDTISHALKFTVTSPYKRQEMHITSTPGLRTEVGILAEDKPPNLEPYEVGVSGLLTVLGQDSKASPTLFSFPSRHRQGQGAFDVKLLEPTGLHPTLQIRINSERPLDDSSCSPHAYFTLPRYIFPDKYQLSDDLFLNSKNLTALRYISQPVDLEAPEYVMDLWGSAVLLELSPKQDHILQRGWTAEVPLHLRYLSPTEGGYRNKSIPYPVVFWACHAEEGTKFPTNPFERVNLGYDGLFGPRTVFFHIPAAPGLDKLQNTISVPVLDANKTEWVNTGTAAAILLGFAWVLWKLYVSYSQQNSKRPLTSKDVEDKKRK